MLSFRDIINEDIVTTFMNANEFGEPHNIDGKEMLVIIDSNEMLERETRYKVEQDGISLKQFLFYAVAKDYGKLPSAGSVVAFDHKNFIVTDSINEDGIYSISLEANFG